MQLCAVIHALWSQTSSLVYKWQWVTSGLSLDQLSILFIYLFVCFNADYFNHHGQIHWLSCSDSEVRELYTVMTADRSCELSEVFTPNIYSVLKCICFIGSFIGKYCTSLNRPKLKLFCCCCCFIYISHCNLMRCRRCAAELQASSIHCLAWLDMIWCISSARHGFAFKLKQGYWHYDLSLSDNSLVLNQCTFAASIF